MRTLFAALAICLVAQDALAADICDERIIPSLQAPASAPGSAKDAMPPERLGRNAVVAAYLKEAASLTLFAGCTDRKPVQGSYLYYKDWYVGHVGLKRFGSQFFAVLTIALAALLPVLTSLERFSKYHKLWISITGAAIVIAQGLTQSFHFDESWKGYMLAQLRLEVAHRQWQREVVDASFLIDGGTTLERLQEATREFDQAVASAVFDETQAYFSATQKARASGPR